jgi:16S rRNA (adenine1518-N6/adenine1519-N6)-dimethyltransferase
LPQDALTVDYATIAAENGILKLAANLPYNISTAILQRLIEQRSAFSEMVLMFQKEVVDRVVAKPGTSERGFLTVITEAAMEVDHLLNVPPSAFRPAPKVNSAVVRMRPKPEFPDPELFIRLVSSAFAQKRKTILNNLKRILPDAERILVGSGIETRRRAETLNIEEWHRLAAAVKANK